MTNVAAWSIESQINEDSNEGYFGTRKKSLEQESNGFSPSKTQIFYRPRCNIGYCHSAPHSFLRRKREKKGKKEALPHNLSRSGHKMPFSGYNYWLIPLIS